MLYKLALRNVKRSFKDYAIYFLTLTFAICIFYSFNSLSGSSAMGQLSSSQNDMLEQLMDIMSGVSVFVSVVLAFLIVYANNFLVRRRKKELGIYMTLGMRKNKISQILVLETLLVGMLSLISGLLLGFLVSQGLSALTVSLFEVNVSALHFVFSPDALLKTILYFGIIFFIVMLFNSFMISRYKLIDLMMAAKKNEQTKMRNPWMSFIVFILSIILLATAYTTIMKYGLFDELKILWLCVGLGVLGSLLFFMSLSSILLLVIQRNKKIYFKGVNMFVLRQINSKVNTTFLSMTIICLMLFFTIGVFSTALSLKDSLERDIEKLAPYDASLVVHVDEEDKDVINAMEKRGLVADTLGETDTLTIYNTDLALKDILGPYRNPETEQAYSFIGETKVNAITRSDYEEMMEMQGSKPLELNNDEVILLSVAEGFEQILQDYIEQTDRITLNGITYAVASQEIEPIAYRTNYYGEEILTIVVPDEASAKMIPVFSAVNINYAGNGEKIDEEIYEALDMHDYDQYGSPLLGYTKTLIFDVSVGTSTLLVFVAMYVGIVFLISSAAVLALQQLSEASDNMKRYEVLKKIGMTKKEINKAIFLQVFIYFMVPLGLAIVHSIFGVQVVNDAVQTMKQVDILLPSFLTALLLFVVYGGYFIATYIGYKNIVK
ncbi:MAG: FtsX-like permease family protein [Bacillus sp. (in: firmicutes)]